MPPAGSSIHSTAHVQPPVAYTFHVETPAAVRERLNNAPSRNAQRNKQRANAILFTPNRPRGNPTTVQHSVPDSPTPAGRSGNSSVFDTAADSGLDEPEQFIQRLNLGDSNIAGPLHGRPRRKAPPAPKKKSKVSDVWTFMDT